MLRAGHRLIGYLAKRHELPGKIQRSAPDHSTIRAAILDAQGDGARDLMLAHVCFTDTMALEVINARRR